MLHLKYRPSSFDEITGHKEIIDSLKGFFEQKEIPHSFLLTGESGCGKTTIARIIAKNLEAEITEINVANTTGIDFVRELDRISRVTSLIGNNKVFILDEVQQLSKEAQNCILKLLEDSPSQSYFVLCTTDSSKLLSTIRNRCTSFVLKSLSNRDIKLLLQQVALLENIKLNLDIYDLLVLKAEGCPRKALVMLNQVRITDNLDTAVTLLANELNDENEVIDLCRLITKKSSWKEIVGIFENIKADPENVRISIAGYLGACLKKADDPRKFGKMLELFLTPLAYGTQKSEVLYLLYRSYMLYL